MSLVNENNSNEYLENILASFVNEIDEFKEELLILEEKYESLLDDQEEGSKKLEGLQGILAENSLLD